MATATTAPKVRLVRCPKCLLVLPEVADFPVYKCGGCDTILVAKSKKPIAESTSVLQETEAAPPAAAAANKSIRVLEHGESSGSTLQEVLPSSTESQTSQECGGDRDVPTSSYSVEHGEYFSVEGQSNGRYTSRDSDGDGACAMLDENRSTGSRSEEHGEDLPVEGELNGHYDKDQITSRGGGSDRDMLDVNRSTNSHSEGHGDDLSLEGELNGCYEKSRNSDGDGECDRDKLDGNRSNEGQQNGTGLLRMESFEHCNGSLSKELHHENEDLKFAAEPNLEAEANDMTLWLGGADSELETSNKIDSNTIGSQEGERRGVKSVRSTDTFDTVDFVSLGSEFSEPIECLSKSTTVRSSHAYDGNISSFDGRNDHFPDQKLHSFENGYKPANFSSDLPNKVQFATQSYGRWHQDGPIEPLSYPRLERDQFPSQPQSYSLHGYEGAGPSRESRNKPLGQPRNWPRLERGQYPSPIPLPPRARKHPSQVPLPQRASLRGNESAGPSRELRDGPIELPRNPRLERDQQHPSQVPLPQRASLRGNETRELRDELLEPSRNWPALERDQYPYSIHLPQRASLRGNESAGPSHELRDEFPFDSPLHRLKKTEYGDEENMKLLRMVYELQDQISKTYHLNGDTNGRTSNDVPWKQSHFDTYNHQEEPPEDDNFHPTHYGRYGLNRRTRFSRVTLSGGAINTRHGIDNTCLCCHPQALQHSEQLHPPMFPHNQGFCRGGRIHSCYNSYSSCPSSPQRCLESEFSNWTHETKSDDQRYREHELKRYLREKHHSVRRHIRPTTGGAPFVTCYHCIKPLQLPADFLLFKRRFHQLRCGSCSKVLKFSLRKGTQLVPYEMVAEAPPPSEVEDYSDAINIRISGLASSSDASTETDPSSFSVEYGHSFDISCSTDGNPLSKPKETPDSAGPFRSKKASSEFEGSPLRTRVSPLHRLMGYSTLSQVLGRHRPSISDTSSIHSGKN